MGTLRHDIPTGSLSRRAGALGRRGDGPRSRRCVVGRAIRRGRHARIARSRGRASLVARCSLLEYFHGRSQLATWLRSVLSQRHVDLNRSYRRLEPLESEDGGDSDRPPNTGRIPVTQTETVDPDRGECITLFQQVLGAVVGALAPRDRLRLCCYYTQELTLAATGRVLGEHEATVSRRLASARKGIRTEVERILIDDHGLSQSEVKLCYRYVTEESAVDLSRMLASQGS